MIHSWQYKSQIADLGTLVECLKVCGLDIWSNTFVDFPDRNTIFDQDRETLGRLFGQWQVSTDNLRSISNLMISSLVPGWLIFQFKFDFANIFVAFWFSDSFVVFLCEWRKQMKKKRAKIQIKYIFSFHGNFRCFFRLFLVGNFLIGLIFLWLLGLIPKIADTNRMRILIECGLFSN